MARPKTQFYSCARRSRQCIFLDFFKCLNSRHTLCSILLYAAVWRKIPHSGIYSVLVGFLFGTLVAFSALAACGHTVSVGLVNVCCCAVGTSRTSVRARIELLFCYFFVVISKNVCCCISPIVARALHLRLKLVRRVVCCFSFGSLSVTCCCSCCCCCWSVCADVAFLYF